MNTPARCLLVLGLAATGCASSAPSVTGNAGQIKDVVVCTMKPDRSEEDRTAVLRLANDYAKLPGVLDVSAGYQDDDTRGRPGVQRSTVTFILTFPDRSAMERATNSAAYGVIQAKLAERCESVTATRTVLEDYRVSEQFIEETTTATRERRAAAVKQQNELRSMTR